MWHSQAIPLKAWTLDLPLPWGPDYPSVPKEAHFMAPKESIQRSSTEAMPPGMRFDYWLSMLRQSLWPVSEWDVSGDFNFDLQEASLGCLTSMREVVSPHHSRRTRADVDGSRDRCYLLFANQHSWQVAHHGHSEKIPTGRIH